MKNVYFQIHTFHNMSLHAEQLLTHRERYSKLRFDIKYRSFVLYTLHDGIENGVHNTELVFFFSICENMSV